MSVMENMTEPELASLMRDCAKAIDQELWLAAVTKYGTTEANSKSTRPKFALLVFDDPKVAQYISSCQREDMIKALRESADRMEKRQDVARGAQ